MPSLAAADIQLIVVDYCRVSSATARYGTVQFRLCPMSGFEIEDNDVGKMLAMLVLTAKYEELVTLPKTCGVSYIEM